MRTLDLIGEDRFETAFVDALEESPFRPSIALIRRKAGILPTEPVDPIREEALHQLERIFQAMREHGWMLKPIPPKILTDRSPDGRPAPRDEWTWTEEIPPPQFSVETQSAILDLGFGAWYPGLEVISRHPCLRKPAGEDEDPAWRAKLARDVDNAFCKAYAKAKE